MMKRLALILVLLATAGWFVWENLDFIVLMVKGFLMLATCLIGGYVFGRLFLRKPEEDSTAGKSWGHADARNIGGWLGWMAGAVNVRGITNDQAREAQELAVAAAKKSGGNGGVFKVYVGEGKKVKVAVLVTKN